MIRAVLFDMYRTLGEDIDNSSFVDSLSAHGLSPEDAQYVTRVADTDAFDGAEHDEASTDREQYDAWRRQHLLEALEKIGVEYDVAQVIVDQYGDWKLGMVKKFKPYPETHHVLERLREEGLSVVVCSNWDWDIEHVIEELGILDAVDAVFTSAQIGVRKPHPAFFERILEKLEFKSDETMFVGDTWATDIAGALGVGMHAVWIDRYDRVAPAESLGVTRVESLTGVLDAVEEFRS
jgi:HAD superfamily hydrolase (TIGR01662 family)